MWNLSGHYYKGGSGTVDTSTSLKITIPADARYIQLDSTADLSFEFSYDKDASLKPSLASFKVPSGGAPVNCLVPIGSLDQESYCAVLTRSGTANVNWAFAG